VFAAGRAIVVAARVERLKDATIRAKIGGARVIAPVRASAAGKDGLVARRWARVRIDELLAAGGKEQDITRLALDHGLVTPYTALVARGERVTVQGGVRTSVAVPVAMPAGMRWQSVFGPKGDVGKDLDKAEGNVDATGREATSTAAPPPSPMVDEETRSVPPMAPSAGGAGAQDEADYAYAETISVSGGVYRTRPWTASLDATVGFHVRDGTAHPQGAVTATGLRRVARDWQVGLAGKLQLADVEGGLDANLYLDVRTFLSAGALPIVTFDLGVGPSLDVAGVGWRLGARLGPWRFAPALTIDQTYVAPDDADEDWSSRTSVGVGVDWSF
jgi:hypothetical protein